MRANHPQQLHVFDNPHRDDRGWVLSVAFLDAIPADRIVPSEGSQLVPVEKVPRLSYDHNDIIAVAVEQLREDYAAAPDPWHLPPDAADGIVIRELRALHEAVAGGELGVSARHLPTQNAGVRPSGHGREAHRRTRQARRTVQPSAAQEAVRGVRATVRTERGWTGRRATLEP